MPATPHQPEHAYASFMTESAPMFRVSVELDGTPYQLLIAGASEDDVRAQLRADFKSGELCTYRAASGADVSLRWSKVATIGTMVIAPT